MDCSAIQFSLIDLSELTQDQVIQFFRSLHDLYDLSSQLGAKLHEIKDIYDHNLLVDRDRDNLIGTILDIEFRCALNTVLDRGRGSIIDAMSDLRPLVPIEICNELEDRTRDLFHLLP